MNRALIVIDVQESFRARPTWEQVANPKIAEPVNRLVRLARASGDLVVWVLHTEPGSQGVFDPAQGHVRLLEELERPKPGERVLHKTSHNAFTTTNLQLQWPDLSPGDLVVVPGWRAPTLRGGPQLSPAEVERLRAHHAAGGTVASVCAGAEALGQAGLLDGRRCTTHHDHQDELAARYPRAMVVRDVLFTVDDRVVTSAGIASGIDLALHLLAVRHGPALAAQVARDMVIYARRNGHEPQASAMLRHRAHLDDAVHRVQDLIDERLAEPLPLAYLAACVGVSERTLTRLFSRATGGLTPLRYQQILRLERAQHLIDHGTMVEAAAREVGFEDARMLRRLRARAS